MCSWEVRPSSRARERGLRVALILLMMAVPAAFYTGSWWRADELRDELIRLEATQTSFDEQARALDDLRQRMAVVSSGEQLAQQANEQSRLTIKLLEEQVFKQQQELAFYQGVLAPDSRDDGLRIRSVDIHPTEQHGVFRYKILLSRVGKDEQALQGRLRILIQGKQNGKARKLSLTDLSADLPADTDESGVVLNFRHFQAIPEGGRQGELRLPDGFEAEQISIQAQIKGSKPVERQFKWTD